jgi:chorismate mutase
LSKDQLEDLRTAVDKIDQELLSLIKKRLTLTGEIGRLKKETNRNIIDAPREAALFEALARRSEELALDKVFVKNLWRLILNASYLSQEK